jgi:histidinol phosphatase-like enzyme
MHIFRWLYVASACKDLLLHNNMDPAAFTIIHARATDVQISKQLPVPCNLLVANGILDDGG